MKRRFVKHESEDSSEKNELTEPKNENKLFKILPIVSLVILLTILCLVINRPSVKPPVTKFLVIQNTTASNKRFKKIEQESCGMSYYENSVPLFKIINGIEANPHSQPWIISLRSVSQPGYLSAHICGGSLISDQHVLTAAHCVTSLSPESAAVLVGLHSLNSITRDNYYPVENIWIHEGYTGTTGYFISNDIAVIKLSEPIVRSDKVQTVCLPSSAEESVVRMDLIASGWGNVYDGYGNQVPEYLQTTKLRVINGNPACDSNGDWDYNNVLCTIEPGANPDSNVCFGDSGGPLVRPKNGAWTLYGVTSYVMVRSDAQGRYRCRTDKPSYYVNVAKYLNWIHDKIQL